MLFKCYLSKTENFGAGFYACFQFKWGLMRVPARARVSCAMIRVPVFAFFSKLEDFIIHILFTGFKERLQKSSEISQF